MESSEDDLIALKKSLDKHHFLQLTGAQRGQPLLLDAVGFIMGLFMNIKIDLLKCIRVAYC